VYDEVNMSGYFLTNQPFIQIFFHEPGVLLFGCLLMLMSATCVLALLVKQAPVVIQWLMGFLLLIHLTLDGILAFDLMGTVTHVYINSTNDALSELFSTHRWLLIQIPILFTLMAMILTWVFKNDARELHAKEYVFAMQFCVVVSFLTVLLIGYESLI